SPDGVFVRTSGHVALPLHDALPILLAGGAHDHGYQTHAITLGRGNQAVTSFVGMAGFEAVHGVVTPQHEVAVGLTDTVPDEFLFLVDGVVLGVILDDGLGHVRHVPGTGDMV